MANTKPKGGLTAWFGKGKKVIGDIGAPKKKGKFQAWGVSLQRKVNVRTRSGTTVKARSMTAAQRRSAVARETGNPGGKPTNVRTMVKEKRRGTRRRSKMPARNKRTSVLRSRELV